LADENLLVHATCVALDEHGILIMGPPGSGKSDLALRLIDSDGRGTGVRLMTAALISDDQTMVTRRGGRLFGASPSTIAGKLEVRGIGILAVPSRREAAIDLAVVLRPRSGIERMPPPAENGFRLCGVALPEVAIDPDCASAPARIRAALGHMVGR
jgi:serine kinase of HPr protein (carbohydrate metabolism regulator)